MQAARHLNLKDATIITYDQEGIINEEGITIQIIPAWKWLVNKVRSGS